MLLTILNSLFIASVQLIALTAWSLTAYYGPIYFNAIRRGGWGSCASGFPRYARDMFFQSLVIAVIFAVWSVRLWRGEPPPMSERYLGEITIAAAPILFLIQHDLVMHAIREVAWAWRLYVLGIVSIIAAHLVHVHVLG